MIAATNFSTYLESKVRKTLMLQHNSHFEPKMRIMSE